MPDAVTDRARSAGGVRASRRSRRPTAWQRDDGAQVLEFAMVLPLVFLLLVVVVGGGVLGMDLVTAQSLAHGAARAAAVSDDAAVHAAVERAAGAREVEVALDPPSGARALGDLVAATIRLRSRPFGALHDGVWLQARAVLPVDEPLP